MRPSKPRISNDAFSYSSYILVQMANNNADNNMVMALAGETSRTINFSVSTLILPAKSPLLITAAYYMFNLLTQEETNDLLNQKHIKLDSSKLRSKIRFYLYNNEKVSIANENNHENYVELEPLCMLYPKDLAENYREVFNPTSDPTNSFTQKPVSEKEKNSSSQDLKKFFTVLVLHPIRANLLTGKFKEQQILNVSETLMAGQALFLMSSPFAFLSPVLYKNTVNVVNISKVAQVRSRGVFKKSKRNYLFIIDHAYKEGEEGSPIFNEYSQVVGILLGNMAPISSELAGFSVCLSISCIVDLLSMLSFHHNTHDVWRLTISKFRPFVQSLPLRSLYPRIVKIFTGSGLGSGVLLNSAGLVLTNKHVIENIQGKTIVVEINYNHQNDYEHYDATLFQASEGNIDVALLKLTSKLSDKALKAIKTTERFLDHPVDVRYLHGKEVYAMGYTFNELRALDLRATVTKGHLSKVIAYKNIPFLIATTCPVYNGFSGGAIVSNRGEFLGLITYSFKNNKKGVANSLNFSYSCNMFKEMIGLVDLRDDDDIKGLDMWKKTDGYVEKMTASQAIEYVPCFDFKPKL